MHMSQEEQSQRTLRIWGYAQYLARFPCGYMHYSRKDHVIKNCWINY